MPFHPKERCNVTELIENVYFQDWVAITVCRVLGYSQRGVDRKCALTYAVSRMDACQVGSQEYFNSDSPESMRVAEEVFANLLPPLEKRRLH